MTEIGKKHIMGVQGQLFAETIRSFDGVEYLLFPKILGLAERGWNAHPVWENLSGMREQQAFNQALALYYEKISKSEMPYWAKNGINFRLPQPGLLVKMEICMLMWPLMVLKYVTQLMVRNLLPSQPYGKNR